MKAIVLRAGMGTRLGKLTAEAPKPMLDIAGRPLLSYILANLARHGFRDVVINLHFQPRAIKDHFGDGSALGLRIAYSFEPDLLGTARGVRHAARLLGPGPILVHYGDVLTNQDLGAMLAFHREKRAELTLLLHERACSNSIVLLGAGQRIEALLERPDEAARARVASPWVNSGIYLMEPSVLAAIPPEGPCDFPRDVFPGLIAKGGVFGYPLEGYRCAIDSPERLDQARADLPRLDCPIPGEEPTSAMPPCH